MRFRLVPNMSSFNKSYFPILLVAVFQAEYTDLVSSTSEFCSESIANGFSGILKDRELFAPFESC